MGYFSPEVHEHFRRTDPFGTGSHHRDSLEAIVSQFPVPLKQALYAASEKGRLNNGTWDDCGFNAAGKAVGQRVTSHQAAADAFNIPVQLVTRFIDKWDSLRLSQTGLSRLLKSVLLDVGVMVPVAEYVREPGTIVIDVMAFKGAETEFIEQLAAASTPADLGISDEEFEAAASMVHDLVTA